MTFMKMTRPLYKKIINIIMIILTPLTRNMIKKYGDQPIKHQPIFIIGSPRTGSTILYQILTNYYDIIYINNLVSMCSKNLFLGVLLSQKIYGSKSHNNFKSYYGDTHKFSENAPSECGKFWYRWFSRKNHFVDFDTITDEDVHSIRQEITAVTNYFNKPFIFKNLNMGQRLRFIKKAFPDAKFIYIKRDPINTVGSILNARKKLGFKKDWWSVKPSNYMELMSLEEHEMCVAQVYYIEKQIERDLRLFEDKQSFKIFYENLSTTEINNLSIMLGFKIKNNNDFPIINKNNKIIKEYSKIQSIVSKYPFPTRDI